MIEWWTLILLVLSGVAVYFWFFPKNMLHTVKGKRVLVTGASQGLGSHIARHYARLGATVVLSSRSPDKLKKMVERCETLSPTPGTKHYFVTGDMSETDDARKVVEEAIKFMGGLDILVLNHVRLPFMKEFVGEAKDLELIDLVMNVDFRSYVHMTAHALPQLLANKGSIVIANNILSLVPTAFLTYGAAAKAALNGFFYALKSQFVELGQDVSMTNCFIGLVGVDEDTREEKKTMTNGVVLMHTAPSDIAMDIIKGVARRQREVYTPYLSSKPLPFLNVFVPTWVDALFRLGARKAKNFAAK